MSSEKVQQSGGSVKPGGTSTTATDKPTVVTGSSPATAPNGTPRPSSNGATNGTPVRPGATGATPAPSAPKGTPTSTSETKAPDKATPAEKAATPEKGAPTKPASPAGSPLAATAAANGSVANGSVANGVKASPRPSGATTPAGTVGAMAGVSTPNRPGPGGASSQDRPTVTKKPTPAGTRPVQPPRVAGSVGRPQPQATPSEPAGDDAEVDDGPRTVRLTVANVDPWSVMKLSFLLAVGAGIMLVVSVMVLWMLLDRMGVFADVNGLIGEIGGKESTFDLNKYVGFSRVVSLSTVVGIVNVLIITALCTIGAFLYNLGSGLVGGLQVTLTDD